MSLQIGELFSTLEMRDAQFFRSLLRSETEFRATGTRLVSISKRTAALVGIGLAAGAVAGVAASVRAFTEFDDKLTQSLAIQGDVTDEMRRNFADVAQAVTEFSRFSATEGAEAIFFLASAGLTAEQQLSALPIVTRFAQAGMFDLATATDLATDAQSALGLTVKETAQNEANLTRVTDVLVKANTLANATVEQFSTALTNRAGAALRLNNIELEEGVALLAAYADSGVKGRRAGLQLSIVLRDLSRFARENSEAFADLNVRVFDSEGEFRNLADVLEDLEGVLEGVSVAEKGARLEMLGFSNESQTAIQTLLGVSGKIRELQAELEDAGGTVEDVATKQMETLSARTDRLGNRISVLAQKMGVTFAPAVGDVAEGLTGATDAAIDLLDALGDLSEASPIIQALQGRIPIANVGIAADPQGNRLTDLVDDFLGGVADLVRVFSQPIVPSAPPGGVFPGGAISPPGSFIGPPSPIPLPSLLELEAAFEKQQAEDAARVEASAAVRAAVKQEIELRKDMADAIALSRRSVIDNKEKIEDTQPVIGLFADQIKESSEAISDNTKNVRVNNHVIDLGTEARDGEIRALEGFADALAASFGLDIEDIAGSLGEGLGDVAGSLIVGGLGGILEEGFDSVVSALFEVDAKTEAQARSEIAQGQVAQARVLEFEGRDFAGGFLRVLSAITDIEAAQRGGADINVINDLLNRIVLPVFGMQTGDLTEEMAKELLQDFVDFVDSDFLQRLLDTLELDEQAAIGVFIDAVNATEGLIDALEDNTEEQRNFAVRLLELQIAGQISGELAAAGTPSERRRIREAAEARFAAELAGLGPSAQEPAIDLVPGLVIDGGPVEPPEPEVTPDPEILLDELGRPLEIIFGPGGTWEQSVDKFVLAASGFGLSTTGFDLSTAALGLSLKDFDTTIGSFQLPDIGPLRVDLEFVLPSPPTIPPIPIVLDIGIPTQTAADLVAAGIEAGINNGSLRFTDLSGQPIIVGRVL